MGAGHFDRRAVARRFSIAIILCRTEWYSVPLYTGRNTIPSYSFLSRRHQCSPKTNSISTKKTAICT